MTSAKKTFYEPLLEQNGFIKYTEPHDYGEMGECWALSKDIGEGIYWVYEQEGLYNIKIHDFYFHRDMIVEFHVPRCLSITYYESISGEELVPYKRLTANCVKSFIGGSEPFKGMIHKKVPIRSIGIEILPTYYEDYLKAHYPDEYVHPFEAFKGIDETEAFPEIVYLLNQIKHYKGHGISAKLFYDAKVSEAVALIVEKQIRKSHKKKQHLSEKDKLLIQSVTSYIHDHYAFPIKQEQLSKIACMGTTKLKATFKLIHGCTITEYIQQRRIHQAEHLLGHTQLSIQEISLTVGYKNGSRFSTLFKKYVGLLPSEYRERMKEA